MQHLSQRREKKRHLRTKPIVGGAVVLDAHLIQVLLTREIDVCVTMIITHLGRHEIRLTNGVTAIRTVLDWVHLPELRPNMEPVLPTPDAGQLPRFIYTPGPNVPPQFVSQTAHEVQWDTFCVIRHHDV